MGCCHCYQEFKQRPGDSTVNILILGNLIPENAEVCLSWSESLNRYSEVFFRKDKNTILAIPMTDVFWHYDTSVVYEQI